MNMHIRAYYCIFSGKFLLHIFAYHCIFREYFLLHVFACFCIFPSAYFCIYMHICAYFYLHILAYFKLHIYTYKHIFCIFRIFCISSQTSTVISSLQQALACLQRQRSPAALAAVAGSLTSQPLNSEPQSKAKEPAIYVLSCQSLARALRLDKNVMLLQRIARAGDTGAFKSLLACQCPPRRPGGTLTTDVVFHWWE